MLYNYSNKLYYSLNVSTYKPYQVKINQKTGISPPWLNLPFCTALPFVASFIFCGETWSYSRLNLDGDAPQLKIK